MHQAGYLFAAEIDPSQLGVAGTTVAILLYIIKTLWADNRELRHEVTDLSSKSLEKITAVATSASHQLSESTKSMEAATVMMHQLAGRPTLSPEQLYEVTRLLRELQNRPS